MYTRIYEDYYINISCRDGIRGEMEVDSGLTDVHDCQMLGWARK
jgi:hypothetical protein